MKKNSIALYYFMFENDVLYLFTLGEVAKLSGLGTAMLNYLCRSGIAMPSHAGQRGRGKKRLYSFGDVLLLRAMARLLAAGVSVKRLKSSFRTLSRRYSHIGPMSRVAAYLVTDGVHIYMTGPDHRLEDLSDGGQFLFAFVIELAGMHAQLRDEVGVLRRG